VLPPSDVSVIKFPADTAFSADGEHESTSPMAEPEYATVREPFVIGVAPMYPVTTESAVAITAPIAEEILVIVPEMGTGI